jgi:hypothetical protein
VSVHVSTHGDVGAEKWKRRKREESRGLTSGGMRTALLPESWALIRKGPRPRPCKGKEHWGETAFGGSYGPAVRDRPLSHSMQSLDLEPDLEVQVSRTLKTLSVGKREETVPLAGH